jgi:hypothetical protein
MNHQLPFTTFAVILGVAFAVFVAAVLLSSRAGAWLGRLGASLGAGAMPATAATTWLDHVRHAQLAAGAARNHTSVAASLAAGWAAITLTAGLLIFWWASASASTRVRRDYDYRIDRMGRSPRRTRTGRW